MWYSFWVRWKWATHGMMPKCFISTGISGDQRSCAYLRRTRTWFFLAPAARHLQAEGIQIQMGTICNLQCFQRSKMDFPLYLARKKRLSRFLGRSKRLNCHLDSVFFQKNGVFGKIHSGVFWRISGVTSRNSGVNNRTLTMDDIFWWNLSFFWRWVCNSEPSTIEKFGCKRTF